MEAKYTVVDPWHASWVTFTLMGIALALAMENILGDIKNGYSTLFGAMSPEANIIANVQCKQTLKDQLVLIWYFLRRNIVLTTHGVRVP